jgi:hypothetical protein
MKYLLLITSFVWSTVAFCQDTIVQKNGASIPAKVMEIDKSNVKYKKFENPDGPSYILPKADIRIIKYQNGSVDTFTVAAGQAPVRLNPQSEMYLKGFKDGETNYTRYRPAANWTFALAVPLNVFGIIPAAAMSATPPLKENLGKPDETLVNNPEYMTGYIAGAKDKKGSKVMKSFIWGGLTSLLLYGTLLGTGVIHP